MNYNIYLDESGNTGNIELNKDLTWNFENQTHFALGAFYMEEAIANDIEHNIMNILHKFDEKLGTTNELKSKAKYLFKNDLLQDITSLLLENKVGFYFDIANKKYKVIMALTDYCIYPYYISRDISSRTVKVEMANFLYKTLPLELVYMFTDICQGMYSEKERVKGLIDFLEKLNGHLFKYGKKDISIKNNIEFVRNYKSYGLRTKNLFPIKDFNNKGVEVSFLPNVDAFNHLIRSIYKFGLKCDDFINIYHDEQEQFSNILTWWTKQLENDGIKTRELQFPISKENILIQIADYYTGSIMRLYRKIIEHNHLDSNDRDLIKILEPLLYKCNIVAPQCEQEIFFSTCEMRMVRTLIPL